MLPLNMKVAKFLTFSLLPSIGRLLEDSPHTSFHVVHKLAYTSRYPWHRHPVNSSEAPTLWKLVFINDIEYSKDCVIAHLQCFPKTGCVSTSIGNFSRRRCAELFQLT